MARRHFRRRTGNLGSRGLTRISRLAGAALALALLAGCKMNLTADIYSTDLRDAMAGTTDLTTPATMAFEVPGTDKCAEHTAKISEIMDGVVSEFAPRGCEKDGTDSFLFADMQILILTSEAEWQNQNALFGLLLIEGKNPDDIGVAVVMNLEKYRTLLARMKEKFHQTIDLASSKVVLVINNDERNPIAFAVRDAFTNAEPIHGERDFELNRRHKAKIRLSNVATAYLAKAGVAGGFVLRGKKP